MDKSIVRGLHISDIHRGPDDPTSADFTLTVFLNRISLLRVKLYTKLRPALGLSSVSLIRTVPPRIRTLWTRIF